METRGEPRAAIGAILRRGRCLRVPYLAHAAKKTGYEERSVPPVQLAWLFRVRQMRQVSRCSEVFTTRLSNAVARMREMLIAPEEARHVPQLLSECGVRFVAVEVLPSSKIDEVCFWLDQHSPVIGMSLRFDRIDNFWFVLRHEIEHVLRGHGKVAPEGMIDAELQGDHAGTGDTVPEEERVANLAASDFCVARDKMNSFIARKIHSFTKRTSWPLLRSMASIPRCLLGKFNTQPDGSTI